MKNCKLTDHVCFVNRALFFVDGIGENPCAEHHESNSRPVPQKHCLDLKRSLDFSIWDFRSVKIIQLILSRVKV